MSLLADLLSKVKHPGSKNEIPPNLKNIVYTSARRSAYKRKIILIPVFIISGILIVYSVQKLNGITENNTDIIGKPTTEIMARTDEQLQAEGIKLEGLNNTGEEKAIESGPSSKFMGALSQSAPFMEKSEKDKSVLRDNSVEKIETKTRKIASAGTSQPLKRLNKKRTLAKKKEMPDNSRRLRKQIDRINTSERDAYLYKVREYEIKKNYSKALSNYKKVLEMEKNNVAVMNNIAYILLHLDLVGESIKYSHMAVDIKEDYVPALINLGVAHIRLGNINVAEGYLKRALMLKSDNQFIIFNLAIFYEKQKNYHEASIYYKKLIRLGDIEGSLGLARIYEKKGRIEEALKIYKNIYSRDFADDKTRILADKRINILNEKREQETERQEMKNKN